MRALLSATVFVLLAGSAAGQSINEFKDNFVRTFGDQCLQTQRAPPENANLPDEVVVKYCGCVTRHAPEVITMDDFAELARTGKRGRELQNKLNAFGKTCVEWIRGEVRDDGPIEPKDRR